MKYFVVFEQGPRNWSAYVPDLPGCITVGDTREETEKLIKEAIEFHLEGLVEDGDPIPQPGTWTSIVEVNVPRLDGARSSAEERPTKPARKRSGV
jgi:predicted RNase H-like HicB family nuclease